MDSGERAGGQCNAIRRYYNAYPRRRDGKNLALIILIFNLSAMHESARTLEEERERNWQVAVTARTPPSNINTPVARAFTRREYNAIYLVARMACATCCTAIAVLPKETAYAIARQI